MLKQLTCDGCCLTLNSYGWIITTPRNLTDSSTNRSEVIKTLSRTSNWTSVRVTVPNIITKEFMFLQNKWHTIATICIPCRTTLGKISYIVAGRVEWSLSLIQCSRSGQYTRNGCGKECLGKSSHAANVMVNNSNLLIGTIDGEDKNWKCSTWAGGKRQHL